MSGFMFFSYVQLFGIVGAFVLAALAIAIVKRYFSKYIKKYIIRDNAGSEQVYRMLEKLIVIIIILVAIAIALFTAFPGLSAYLASTLIAAGFLSVVVGMAAQKSLENIFAGFSIAFSQPFRLGDAVVIDGEYGNVEDITLRQTIIKTWDNRRLVIPNSVLDRDIVINYTLRDTEKLFPITLGVPYDADVEKVGKIMVSEAEKHPAVLKKKLKPIFQVLDFSEGAITLRLLFLAKDQGAAFGAGVDIRRALKRRFDKEKIRFSTPSRYIVNAKGIK